MTFKVDTKSLIVGLLVGLVALSVLGAASARNEGVYQLSMAANSIYVIYGRIHTGTGKIETWKYQMGATRAVPHMRDDARILLGPDAKSPIQQ